VLDRPCNRLRGDLRVVKGMAAPPYAEQPVSKLKSF
jgi:hypothetical protein